MHSLKRFVVVATTAFVALAVPLAAMAHEHRAAGGIEYTVGWLNEPTYAGSVNAVQVELARGGSPLTGANLQVVVIFGTRTGTQKTRPLDLVPSDETPGEYTADIIPTRPGTYTFHVSGTAGAAKIDQYFTSGETTFDVPKDPTADEFPVKDPTNAQMAQRLDSTDTQVSAAAAAKSRSTIALIVAAVGIVVGAVALARR
jgi:hypothetical protein